MTDKQTQPSVQQQAKMWVMIGRQMSSSYPGWTIAISVIVGLVIGLFFAWVIWPVTYTPGKPATMSLQYQQAYLNFAATTYGTGGMPIDQVAYYLGDGWTKEQITSILNGMIGSPTYASNAVYLTKFRDALNVPAVQIGPPPPPQTVSPVLALCLFLVLILLIVLLLFWIVRRILGRRSSKAVPVTVVTPSPGGAAAPVAEATPVVVPAVSRAAGGAKSVDKTTWAGESRPPLTQFVTTYALGDDRYDMSNSIENSAGDFQGECGVGISETIGTGSPDKVTALELWLFDKNDIRTLTKVLMSEHAYNDGAIRAKLAAKGDAVMIRKGDIVELTTKTLKLNARIVDLVYGSGGLPPNSFFQQVTLEIATWTLAE